MTPLTILRFLFGSRDAIERIAACRQAPWIGLLLVFSAALAREYDGQDLLHEPWHLLLPLAASLATSFVLYLLLRVMGSIRNAGLERGWSGYWSFLGLYWMTAPLAWLYAIPVERLLDAGDATRANLWLLAIVAAWRVALMVRVIAVVFRIPWFVALWPLLLFADVVAWLLAMAAPDPLIGVMSGVRPTVSERIVSGATMSVMVLAIFSLPLWAVGTIVAIVWSPKWQCTLGEFASGNRVRISLWAAAIASLLVWLPILPQTQPVQQNRRQIEQLIRAGHVEQAMATLARCQRSDLPPHWDPPPRVGRLEEEPSPQACLGWLAQADAPSWAADFFFDKLDQSVQGASLIHGELDAAELDRRVRAAELYPRAAKYLHRGKIEPWLSDHPELTPALRMRLETLIARLPPEEPLPDAEAQSTAETKPLSP